ncbi:hypothetical protein DPMN_154047 [Dreissena polymorpha]|uniref:Uncharacterized protein n=2 Tax=Dreissena polymorpha TaxID=45954 RepID=A0A9D4FMP4_DREPO|nr:hypothetical protein DPMN_154047 [Dreissena polymorpha]
MARVLQFLCGLDIKSANKLSVIIYEHSKSLDLQVRHQRELQSMVLNGYVEAIFDNKNAGDICLKLSYFDFTTLNINKHKHTDLKEILLINKSNVRTLRLNPDALRCLELSDFEEILHLSETCIERMYIYANDRTHLKTLTTSTYFEFMSTSYNLDLSSCQNLKKLHIDGPLNVLPNAFQGLSMLKCARLKCKCNFLNVSTCQNLNELYVGEHVTLLQNALIGLMNLKMLTVKSVCDTKITLDLSTCRGLEQLIIEGDVILLPNALCELVELKSIKLWCECVGLDVSSCHNLEEMVIFNGVTLASNVILELLKLIRVTIKGRCDTLDLSLCAHLEDVVIDGEVMLLPNALKGLRQLKRISLRCLCSDLDLTQCDNLECIDLGENVTVLPNTLANVKTMARFTLSNNGHKSADILKWWPVHMGGISLPPNLNNVVLRRLNFPPMWLKCLLGTLSKSDHPSQYTFDMCSITTNVESREQTSEGVTHLDYMTIKRSTSNIRLHIGSDCVQLYEALQDTIIESLTIQCVNSFNVLAETLINIIGLKELRINFQTFGDFDIPTSVVYVFLIFSSLSSSSLFNLLNSLSLHNPGVKCKVLFEMTEPKDKYEVVRTKLDSLECIRVERFETLTHIIDCLEMAWNYTDDEDKIDVDDADSEFCCFDTKGIEDEDSDQNEESVASDTDDNDYTCALGADNKSSHQYLLMHLCINSRNCVLPPT